MEHLTKETLLTYSHDLLQATQEYHEAKRKQIAAATNWDEHVAIGLAQGLFTGKNEAARHGEAMEADLDLWNRLCARSEEATEKEHKLKEMMVIDKWVGRTLQMMELEKEAETSYIINTNTVLDDETYKAELTKLMARRLGS